MRYALLMHYAEPAAGEISEEAIVETMQAFGAYGRALEQAGVRVGRSAAAPAAFDAAIDLTHDIAERQYLQRRRDDVRGRTARRSRGLT